MAIYLPGAVEEERIALDEPSGSIPSLAEVFQQKARRSLHDYLALFA